MNIRTLSENAIRWIDTQMIHEILNEMRRKSGEKERVDLPKIRIIQKTVPQKVLEKITWFDKWWWYHPFTDTIRILTERWTISDQTKSLEELKKDVVFTHIHELVHAYGNVSWSKSISDEVDAILRSRKNPWLVSQRVWYSYAIKWWLYWLIPWGKIRLISFNEWMTNWLTISVLEEYYRRKWEKFSIPKETWYDREMWLVIELVEYVSKKIWLPHEDVMKTLRQWYFSGLDIITLLTDSNEWFWLEKSEALKMLWEKQ